MRRITWPALLAAGTLALAACAATDPAPKAQAEHSGRPAEASNSGTASDADPGPKPRRVSVRLGQGLTTGQGETARRFVRFAAAPSTALAQAVPFSHPGITIAVNGHPKRLSPAEAPDANAWFISDGAGTTSALFVISNNIEKRDPDEVAFRATRQQLPICNIDEGAMSTAAANLIFLTLDSGTTCAEGFRVALNLSERGAIDGVTVAVRAP